MPIGCLMLESLEIVGSKIRTLDLGQVLSLKTLSLVECVDLVELHIPAEFLKLTYLHLNLSKLRTLDLKGTLNLEILILRGCYELVELHMPVECLKLTFLDLIHSKLKALDLAVVGHLGRLSYLDLSGCLRFKSFSFTKHLGYLEAHSSFELHLIAESLDTCPLHRDRTLPKFQSTHFYEEHVSSSIENLEKLIFVGLCACINLESFSRSICGLRCLTKLTLEGSIPEAPKNLDQLECLKELRLLSTKIKHLPDSICMLKHLKSLELNPCWLLEKLPEDLGRLERLEKLILSECVFLRDIPDNICKMKRLEYFHLPYCIAVEKLPEDLGCLKCLKELNIEGTNIRNLPQSIFVLKGLRVVGFRWLLQLCGFKSEIQTSGNETFCYI